ncbi:MAG: GLUG motif-containing protein [Bacteroidales bacterium]|nr:GLUG motif-containing protein [Bacteroidales bacterium]
MKTLMNKMRHSFIAVVSLLLLMGCSKADDITIESTPKQQAETIPTLKVLVKANESRATVALDAVTWVAGDKIFGFYEKDATQTQVVLQYNGKTEGDYIVFEPTSGSLAGAANGTTFHMVYAPGMENGITADGKLTLRLADQTGSLDQMGTYNYMYSSGTVSDNTLVLSFDNQIALLKLHAMDFDNAVTTTRVSGEQITNEATLDLKTGLWILGDPAPLVVNCGMEKNNDIYIAMFPCTSKVFVNLEEGANHHDRSVTTAKTFEMSKMYGLDCSKAKCTADNAKWKNDNTIYTAGQLRNFMSAISASSTHASQTVKIGADITVFDNWSYSTFGNFRGVFDGQNHTITLNGASNAPLLNEICIATVKNLTVAGKVNKPYVSDSKSYTGGLVGLMKASDSGTSRAVLEGCTNKASVTSSVSTDSFVGGLAGKAERNALIKDSANKAAVTCNDKATSISVMVGGIAGQTNGTITDCTNSGDVTTNTTCENLYVGGIVGFAYGSNVYTSTVQGCSTDSGHAIQVTNNSQATDMRVGGIVGNGYGNLFGCANNSDVLTKGETSTLFVGGISGHIGNTGITLSIQCCCNRGDVSNSATALENSNVGGFVGKLNLENISITGTYSVAESVSDTSKSDIRNTGTFVGVVNSFIKIVLQECFVEEVTGVSKHVGNGTKISESAIKDFPQKDGQTQELVSTLNANLSDDCAYHFVYRAGDYPVIEMK